MRPYYRAIPGFIIRELWKRRNKKKHEEKNISLPRIIHNVTRHMNMFAKMKRTNMIGEGSWREILKDLEEYRPKVKVIQVKWENPLSGIENTTNTMIEAKVILEASKHCKISQHNQ
ncbi:hypothetical protein H5410_022110, partial [Solanum commersonii]